MSTEITQQQLTTKQIFSKSSVQQKFEELLGKKAPGFISSVLQIVNSNKLLHKADPQTVLNAAATAATLDLPVNPNLGFSWIVPYKGSAAFQMGWRGYVQLALRTGQYKSINVIEVFENQFNNFNTLTEELDADFSIVGEGKIVGYAAYFELINGFKKTCYWTKEKVVKHAKKYSQSYTSNYSPWQDKDQFDAMAKKTVLKNTISKWGIMSIELNNAVMADQSVQRNEGQYEYPDNPQTIDVEASNIEEEENRIIGFINECKNINELEDLKGFVKDGAISEAYDKKEKELKKSKK